MQIERVGKYIDFFERTKNEPIIILQGSKASGKTADILIDTGLKFISSKNGIRIQCFSESPKQQNCGLKYDFDTYFAGITKRFRYNDNQKLYKYKNSELSFLNIPNNINSEKIANSLGTCDIRYVNECNMYSKRTAEILRIKTTGQTIYDFNPWRDFWVNDLITENNFLKTTWRDVQCFLSASQIALFLEWTEKGMKAEVGSYDYWRWQVMCEGNFAQLTGKIFTTENIRFCNKAPNYLHTHIIFADPSNANGGDSFALTLTAIGDDGCMYLIDSFSCNLIEKALIADQIKKWQHDYQVERTYIETNGQYGLKFYNDCELASIPVDGWYSTGEKFERILTNRDVIINKTFLIDNPNNREFAQQIYTFRTDKEKEDEDSDKSKEKPKDDNIDCLNNAALAYIRVFGELKVLF